MPRTTVVLPVPGPPVSTKTPYCNTSSSASFCLSASRMPAICSQRATSVVGSDSIAMGSAYFCR